VVCGFVQVENADRLEMSVWNQKHIIQPAIYSTAYSAKDIDKCLFSNSDCKHNYNYVC